MKIELRVWKKCFEILCSLTQSGSLSKRVDLIAHRAADIADMHYIVALKVSAFQSVELYICIAAAYEFPLGKFPVFSKLHLQ